MFDRVSEWSMKMKKVFVICNEEGYIVNIFSSKEKAIELLKSNSYLKSVMGDTIKMKVCSKDKKRIKFIFTDEENKFKVVYVGREMNIDR